eukprot:Pgem_evm1s6000
MVSSIWSPKISARTSIHSFVIIKSGIIAKKMDKLIVNASTEATDYEDESTTESTTESTISRTEESDYEDEFTIESTTESATESTEPRPRATGLQKKVRSIFVLNISDELRQGNEKTLFEYCNNNNDYDYTNDPNNDDDTNDPSYTGDPSYTSYTSDTS